jgi:hypothetical protein
VGSRRHNAGPTDPWVYVGFADADKPIIRVNLYYEIVLGRTGRAHLIVGVEKDVALYRRNPHGMEILLCGRPPHLALTLFR